MFLWCWSHWISPLKQPRSLPPLVPDLWRILHHLAPGRLNGLQLRIGTARDDSFGLPKLLLSTKRCGIWYLYYTVIYCIVFLCVTGYTRMSTSGTHNSTLQSGEAGSKHQRHYSYTVICLIILVLCVLRVYFVFLHVTHIINDYQCILPAQSLPKLLSD